MNDDLIARLRQMNYYSNGVLSSLPDRAADKIEQLNAQITYLNAVIDQMREELEAANARQN